MALGGSSSDPLACLCSIHKVSSSSSCAYVCVCLRRLSAAVLCSGYRFRSQRSSGLSLCYSGHCELDGELMALSIRFSLCLRPLEAPGIRQSPRLSGFLSLLWVSSLPFSWSLALRVAGFVRVFPWALLLFCVNCVCESCLFFFFVFSKFIGFLLPPTPAFPSIFSSLVSFSSAR